MKQNEIDLIKKIKEFEEIKEKYKLISNELTELLMTFEVGHAFQDDVYKVTSSFNPVYRIVEPKGRYVEFSRIGYTRTRDKQKGEKQGSLSLKEARELGFDVE